VQSLGQLNTLLAVILPIVKGRMFFFSSLMLGLGGLGLMLVSSMGLGIDFGWVGVDLCGTAIVAPNLDICSFRGRWSYLSKHAGPLEQLIFGKLSKR
jgi:hypothetical protein